MRLLPKIASNFKAALGKLNFEHHSVPLLTALITFAITTACKPKNVKSAKLLSSKDFNESMLEPLIHKKKLYLNYLKPREDQYGWLGFHCDSLLFNSIYAFSGGNPQLLAAKSETNKWYRTPAKNCYPKHSGSEISKDMYIGLMLYLFVSQNTEELKKIQRFGVKNSWIMGEGPLTRTVLMPDQRRNLAYALFKLEGKLHVDSELPSGFGLPCEGFGCHLRALDIYMHHLVHGSITTPALSDLKQMVNKNPNNTLFRSILSLYETSHLAKTVELLQDEKRFPLSRLPTNKEHCSDYVNQRDEFVDGKRNEAWLPCNTKKSHHGLSFLFPATILINHHK